MVQSEIVIEEQRMHYTPEDLARSNYLPPERYYERIRDSKEPAKVRSQVVQFYFASQDG